MGAVESIPYIVHPLTMAASFSAQKMARHIIEAENYILPMLEELKRRYLEWNDAAFLLKYQMLSLLETQKALLIKYHAAALEV